MFGLSAFYTCNGISNKDNPALEVITVPDSLCKSPGAARISKQFSWLPSKKHDSFVVEATHIEVKIQVCGYPCYLAKEIV